MPRPSVEVGAFEQAPVDAGLDARVDAPDGGREAAPGALDAGKEPDAAEARDMPDGGNAGPQQSAHDRLYCKAQLALAPSNVLVCRDFEPEGPTAGPEPDCNAGGCGVALSDGNHVMRAEVGEASAGFPGQLVDVAHDAQVLGVSFDISGLEAVGDDGFSWFSVLQRQPDGTYVAWFGLEMYLGQVFVVGRGQSNAPLGKVEPGRRYAVHIDVARKDAAGLAVYTVSVGESRLVFQGSLPTTGALNSVNVQADAWGKAQSKHYTLDYDNVMVVAGKK